MDDSFEGILLSHHYVPDREPAPYTEISDTEEDVIVDRDVEDGHPESVAIVERDVGQSEDSLVSEESHGQTSVNPAAVSDHIPDPVKLLFNTLEKARDARNISGCINLDFYFL